MKSLVPPLAAVVLLAGCTGDPTPPPEPVVETVSATPTPSSRPSPSPGTDPVTAFVDPWVAVACDVGRDPTPVETAFLVEPGPFADNSDWPAAAAAAGALDPGSPEQWATAVQWVLQRDFADDLCTVMQLSFELSDTGEEPEDAALPEAVGSNHFAIALDASGSMAARSGGSTRMAQAKTAIEQFVAGLPASATVSLRIYGHEGTNQEAGRMESCASSEVLYRGAPGDGELTQVLAGVRPVGWTPLAAAIGDAAGDVPEDSTDAILYVVSDGIETCGGDPVEAATEVAATGVRPIINVIGFEVGEEERAALEAVAEAGGGSYVHATNAHELQRYWAEEHARLQTAWHAWREREQARIREAYAEQVRPAVDAFHRMRVGVKYNDIEINSLERHLQTNQIIDWETLSHIIHANDAHLDSLHRYLDEVEPRLREHRQAREDALAEVYETSESWRELYRRN